MQAIHMSQLNISIKCIFTNFRQNVLCYRQTYAYYFILTSPCKPELVKKQSINYQQEIWESKILTSPYQ